MFLLTDFDKGGILLLESGRIRTAIDQEGAMGLFSRFGKTDREYMPLMYYGSNEALGEFLDDTFIPGDLLRNIILFSQRLHEIGVFPENDIVRFNIKEMIKTLQKWEVISRVEVDDFDLAQVVFGRDYSAFLYRGREEEPSYKYLIPHQIVFYHSKKKENYYLSFLSEGIDLCKNVVSVSDREQSVKKIGKGGKARLNSDQMKQLQSSLSILFMYLKYKLLIHVQKKNIFLLLENFSKKFHLDPKREEEFASYCRQYFALNTEKKENYPLAHQEIAFSEFLGRLSVLFKIGVEINGGSFEKYSELAERISGLRMRRGHYDSSFAFFSELNSELKKLGYALYFCSLYGVYRDHVVLIGDEAQRFENIPGLEIIKFEPALRERYRESIELERNIRRVAAEFYESIGGKDVEEWNYRIEGSCVLDAALYQNSNILCLFAYEEDFLERLGKFFEVAGLTTLAENLNEAGDMICEAALDGDAGAFFYDLVLSYAEDIKKNGKLLVYLDSDYDTYEFALIEKNLNSRYRFIHVAERMIEMGELFSYKIFD